MFAEQVQVRAAATGERWWRRLCLASFVLAGITALLVWVAVAELLRQGHLGAVLSAGRAELAAPLLVALVVGTGINALHHSQEELSVLTSFRAHPLMHTTGFLLATIPVVALMPARPIAPVLITIYVCIGTLQHANLRWTFGPVGRVLVSPAYHRLHHAPDIQDANLGVVLTIWDVLAGRARFPSRADSVNRTGLDGRPVPVEQEALAGPALLLVAGQLAEPFRTRALWGDARVSDAGRAGDTVRSAVGAARRRERPDRLRGSGARHRVRVRRTGFAAGQE